MGCEQTILYSSGFATVASVIPTFAKRNDIIFCDAGVNHAVATGVNLSRSHIVYFRHNDMAHLAELLDKAASDPQTARKRKFVVCEGLYYNYGDVLPLPQVLKLKDRHCFYLIVDESYSVGTLGAHGGGLLEVYGGKRGGCGRQRARAQQRRDTHRAAQRNDRYHYRQFGQRSVLGRRLLLRQQ